MANQIDICNLALRYIGEQPIGALDEGSEAANVLTDMFDLLYKEELRGYPWRWASTTVELAAVTETPPDFAYVHQLPADYVQVQRLIEQNSGETLYDLWDELYGKYVLRNQEWEIRENKLYSNWSDVTLKYTKLITDYSSLDPTFVEAFAWRLAFAIAPSITDKQSYIDRAYQQYQITINKARGQNGQEQRRRLNISREYLGARNFYK